MRDKTNEVSDRIAMLWHMPAVLILMIYLPGTLIGVVLLHDIYAYTFLGMLAIFVVTYYVAYPQFAKLLQKELPAQQILWKFGDCINWNVAAWLCLFAYLLVLGIVIHQAEMSPLGAALAGRSTETIALARSGFYTGLTGSMATLRYLSLILGRSIMPVILVSLFYSGHKLRYVALFVLLATYLVSLEKAAAIFAIMPIIILYLFQKRWKAATGFGILMILCIALWTFLALGGIDSHFKRFAITSLQPTVIAMPAMQAPEQSVQPTPPSDPVSVLANQKNADAYAESQKSDRRLLIRFLPVNDPYRRIVEDNPVAYPIFFMLNRIIWIPYITAYDWLRFQAEILDGKLTMGRSIAGVSWLFGQPKMPIENMVYEYEFGTHEGIIGASNTVFFVDAKLGFGLLGVFLYCLLFTFFSAIIFSSKLDALKIASFTTFLTASLSALTATLLSGGLFFYLVICVLRRRS